MKNRITIFGLTSAVIIIQFFWIKRDDSFDLILPFLSELESADTVAGNIFLLMYSYLPFTFFLLCFSESMRELIMGYGLLLTVRGQSRIRLMGKLMLKCFVIFSCITAVTGALYTIGCAEWWMPIAWQKQLQALLLYNLTVITMIQLQHLLELYMESHHANGVVILFGLISLFVRGIISVAEHSKTAMLNLLLFPNLAFAKRNGILGPGEISFPVSLLTLLIIYFVLTMLILQSFRRKDII